MPTGLQDYVLAQLLDESCKLTTALTTQDSSAVLGRHAIIMDLGKRISKLIADYDKLYHGSKRK